MTNISLNTRIKKPAMLEAIIHLAFIILGVSTIMNMMIPTEAVNYDVYVPYIGMTTMVAIRTPELVKVNVPSHLLSESPYNYTTHLITSNMFPGPLFMARGKRISDDDTAEVLNGQKPCDCKKACILASWCVAFSSVKEQLGESCILADHLPYRLVDDDESTYHVFYERNQELMDMYTFKGTNHIYLVPFEMKQYQDAKSYCSRFPGFRMPVFITKLDIDILRTLNAKIGMKFWVGLVRNYTLEAIYWEDGTPYASTYYPLYNRYALRGYNNLPYFRFQRDVTFIFTEAERDLCRVVCQAYLF